MFCESPWSALVKGPEALCATAVLPRSPLGSAKEYSKHRALTVLLRPQVQDFFGDQIVADIGRAYAVTFPLPQLPRAKPACLDRARSTSSRRAPHAGRLLTA